MTSSQPTPAPHDSTRPHAGTHRTADADDQSEDQSDVTPTETIRVPRMFEGRRLPRPDEDVEDQGLAFDLGTVLSRRRMLGALGLGAGVATLAACGAGAVGTGSGTGAVASSSSAVPTDLTEMNSETAGPYPGDGSNGPDVLDMSGVERRDIRGSIGGGATAPGVEMTLRMNLIDMAGGNVPMTGAAVYVWHCDAEGRYSMYDSALADETYLRGVQIAGADGSVTFTSIVPGCYAGRWPHIHFEVFPNAAAIADASTNVLTSQIALPQDMCELVYADGTYGRSGTNLRGVSLDSDNVFSDGWEGQMPTVTGDVTTGYGVVIDVPIDTATEQTGGGMPAGGPGGGGPGGGGPGGPGGVGPGGGGPGGGGPGGSGGGRGQ